MLHTTYFGSVSWYKALFRDRALLLGACPLETIIDSTEHYVKQTDRNHCRIATANGVQKLTVPVTVPTKNHCPIRDVRVSDHGNWRHQHWEALCSAYGMSPFFEYYADDIRPFFDRKWDFLYDYNMEIMSVITGLIGESHSPATSADVAEPQPYYQTFHLRHGFIPDLSILDLLFNEGPEAILYL